MEKEPFEISNITPEIRQNWMKVILAFLLGIITFAVIVVWWF
ncbi:MAG TPA: hypothetical protein VJ912_00630 [Candidatus Nanoarchaeia archaeon]|nr:hypothetical protein [Candidatus Nanoarchaeia archaeon]